MPTRGSKRGPHDWDPNKSDPEDETYGTSVSKPPKSKHARSKSSKSARRRQRQGYSSDDNDEELDSLSSDGEEDFGASEEENEQDELEYGASGRPRRKAAPSKPILDKSGSEDEDIGNEDQSEEEAIASESDGKEGQVTPKNRRGAAQRKIVRLRGTPGKFPPKLSPSGPTRRSTRARSSSVTASRPSSSHKAPSRRSSRIAQDDTEGIYALSNSGHHVETLRQATSSPPPTSARPQTGGKGIKKPTTSVVYEASQESSRRSKRQGTEDAEDQMEVAASRENLAEDTFDIEERVAAAAEASPAASHGEANEPELEVAVVPESGDEDYREDDDEDPISKPGRSLRRRGSKRGDSSAPEDSGRKASRSTRQNLRSGTEKRKARSSQRGVQESSDFDPEAEEEVDEDLSASDESVQSPRKRPLDEGDDESPARGAKRQKINTRSRRQSDERDSAEEQMELQEELVDLKESSTRRKRSIPQISYERPTRRQKQRPDYRIINPELQFPIDDDDAPPAQSTPSKRARGAGGTYQRSLFSTYGPFGGAGGLPPVLGGPDGLGAAGGADSDSSDDEIVQRPKPQGIGGLVGMTPTTANPPNLGLYPAPAAQVHGADPAQTPANLGKIKDKQALADADPLGVDQNVNFDAVGGLEGHIDQLKEMVALPLLYPEVFLRFKVTPPRGVLFHGPPGTGKTLLARALASSVSSQGKKVTFYMRKGADALSKWVGEAEKQLRLLFEEARKNQPSIIFFDEIDGAYST